MDTDIVPDVDKIFEKKSVDAGNKNQNKKNLAKNVPIVIYFESWHKLLYFHDGCSKIDNSFKAELKYINLQI